MTYDGNPHSATYSTVTGVAKIGVDGGAVEEYQVTVDPAKLRRLIVDSITRWRSEAKGRRTAARFELRRGLSEVAGFILGYS